MCHFVLILFFFCDVVKLFGEGLLSTGTSPSKLIFKIKDIPVREKNILLHPMLCRTKYIGKIPHTGDKASLDRCG